MEEVLLVNHQFDPQEFTVPAGTEVVFRNEDDDDHTVTADDHSFDSGTLGPGESYSYTFDSPGECSYHCEFHPDMRGHVTVE